MIRVKEVEERLERIKDVLRSLPEEQLMNIYNKYAETDDDCFPIIPMTDFTKYCSGTTIGYVAEKFLHTPEGNWSFGHRYFKEGDGNKRGEMLSIAEGYLAENIWLDSFANYINDEMVHFGIEELMDIICDEFMVIIAPRVGFERYETVKTFTQNMAIEFLKNKFGEDIEIKKVYKRVKNDED